MADTMHAVGRYANVHEVLRPLLESATVDEDYRMRAQARVGWAALFLGEIERSESLLVAAVSHFAPTGKHADLAVALRWLGEVRQAKGELTAAIEDLNRALAAALRDPDHVEVGSCLSNLGIAYRVSGEYRRSLEMQRRCLVVWTEGDRLHHVGRAHANMAIVLAHQGQFSEAHKAVCRARKVFDELESAWGIGSVAVVASRIARARGELAEALEHAAVALQVARETGYKRLEVLALEEQADNHLAQGQPRAAAETLDKALKLATKIAPRGDLVYEVSWRLARACRRIGHISRARQLAESATEMASTTADALEHALAKEVLAGVRFDLGDRDGAQRLIDEVIEALRRLEATYYLAQAHEVAATFVLDGDGDDRTAIAHLHEAVRLYARTGVEHATAAAEQRLRRVEEKMGLPPYAAGDEEDASGPVIAVSAAMRHVFEMARRLADYDSAILIEGPTGSGKEVIARTIHASGAWANRPFRPLNCASLPKHLLESELFGHRRGAFTGAESDRVGHLEAASDGIVFLDEIDKTDRTFQSKLLRVLEDRQLIAVGETEPRPFRARILCASNRGLRSRADAGGFLPDLYFRLAAGRIEVPPLNERPEDTEALAEAYLERSAKRFGVGRLSISREARAALMVYDWPGNVRELKNAIELASFLARGEKELKPEHLPVEIARALDRAAGRTLPSQIEEVERREIHLALRKADGSRTHAAKILGVSRKGLLDRLRRLRMEEW